MMGQQVRFARADIGEMLLESLGDALVPFAPARQQQAFIGDVADQRVLEDKTPLQAALLGKDNSRCNELRQFGLEFLGTSECSCFEQQEGKLSADHGGDLRQFAGFAEPVEPRHQ